MAEFYDFACDVYGFVMRHRVNYRTTFFIVQTQFSVSISVQKKIRNLVGPRFACGVATDNRCRPESHLCSFFLFDKSEVISVMTRRCNGVGVARDDRVCGIPRRYQERIQLEVRGKCFLLFQKKKKNLIWKEGIRRKLVRSERTMFLGLERAEAGFEEDRHG
jgi:hypothetical protein